MAITTITTHIEPGAGEMTDSALESALSLASAHGAQVSALIFATDLALETVPHESTAPDGLEDRAAAHVEAAAQRHGVSIEFRTRSSFAYGIGEVMADHLRVSDLGIIGVRHPASHGERILIGASVFGSGRPAMLIPAGTRLGPRPNVVVGWDATPACVRAVHDALPFIKAAQETLVVTVTDDKEIRKGQSGIELTHLLARHGARASFSPIQRSGRSVYEALAAKVEEVGGATPRYGCCPTYDDQQPCLRQCDAGRAGGGPDRARAFVSLEGRRGSSTVRTARSSYAKRSKSTSPPCPGHQAG